MTRIYANSVKTECTTNVPLPVFSMLSCVADEIKRTNYFLLNLKNVKKFVDRR